MPEERNRLARELHDGIAQDLVALGYSLDLLLADSSTSSGARIELRTIRFTITELIEKVRREIYQLRRSPGFSFAIEVGNISQFICKDFHLVSAISEVDLPAEGEIAYEMIKILSELLRNIVSHSGATSISIELRQKGEVIELLVSDDGKWRSEIETERYGILGIQERAVKIGALLVLLSDENGTQATLQLPIRELPIREFAARE